MNRRECSLILLTTSPPPHHHRCCTKQASRRHRNVSARHRTTISVFASRFLILPCFVFSRLLCCPQLISTMFCFLDALFSPDSLSFPGRCYFSCRYTHGLLITLTALYVTQPEVLSLLNLQGRQHLRRRARGGEHAVVWFCASPTHLSHPQLAVIRTTSPGINVPLEGALVLTPTSALKMKGPSKTI